MVGDDVGLNANMDRTLLDFIRTKVNSFVKWDLVKFFYENPHTTDTAANIALYTGRDASLVARELQQLTMNGLLQSMPMGQMTVYTLSINPEIRVLIDRFIRACNDRQFRTYVVRQVMQGT